MKTDYLRQYYLKALMTLIIVTYGVALYGQDYAEFYQQSLHNNKNGMYVLGTWAVANLAVGGIGWSQTAGKTKYFHQMNFFWNTVNLGIAGFGYLNAIQTDIMSLSSAEMLSKHKTFENILLLNAGLDIGYMGLGYYLNHLSKTKEKNKHQLAGYGNSIMLQGAFLFGFDLVLYWIQRNHRVSFLTETAWELMLYPNKLEFVYRF